MLKTLLINNYALINKLEIDFQNGFSVITGETGAGKSILIGALSLILGNRSDSTVLFNKEAKCVVEGTFEISSLSLENFFNNHELDYDSNTILRREISVNGKSRAFINDTPVKLNILKELGSFLVDIHSQHETLKLNNSSFQLDVIDKYGTNEKLLFKYHEGFNILKRNQKKLEELTLKNESSRRDEEYFKFMFNELDEAQLNEEEIISLIEREKLLAHAEEVNSVVETTRNLLQQNENSVSDEISSLVDSFGKLANYHISFKEIYDRLFSINIEIKDIAAEMDSLLIEGDFDEQSLQSINNRLNIIYSLQQKHSVDTVAELISLKDEFESKLSGILNLEEEIENLRNQLAKEKEELLKQAQNLSVQRQKGAKLFAASMNKIIRNLGMPDAEFSINFNLLEDLTPKGLDSIDFMFNSNKGGQSGEISKVASGGELSRLMLAVKSLITTRKLLPTIIFDEIDTGVSGDIAGKVGDLLRQMSENHQLIAISHLPQIAGKAASHYFVFKENKNGKTNSNIVLLNNNDRVEEIAKMLSNESVSESARETARGLIS
jgi:DNA repair protein RecN (Recombination protein N)